MFSTKIFKSIPFRNGLFIVFIFVGFNLLSQKFDPVFYEEKYPDEEFILLNHEVNLELIDSEDALSFKTKHKKEYLSLEYDAEELNRFLLTFSETQDLKVTMARYYEYEDGKKNLVKNVKTKWLKPRDHYIKGVFYNDIKDLEISTSRVLEKYTHVIIEYEVIDNDLKFISPIYASSFGKHVVNFSVRLKEPYDAIVDLVPFNIDNDNFIYSNSDGFTSYSAKDISRIKENSTTPPYNYIAPHFVPVVREVGDTKYLASVEDLYFWYKGLINQVEMNTPEISSLASVITSGDISEEEKIQSIFKYVQSKIDYLAFEDGIAGFKPSSAIEVIQTGYGDCKGMSNLLVDLLRNVGIDAGHAWIGTRKLNYTYDLAALCVDNHMVCWVNLNDEIFILDATGKGHFWNRIPSHLQGKQTLLGLGESFKVIEIPIAKAETNSVLVNATIDLDCSAILDTIRGEIKLVGNDAIDYHMALQSLSVQSNYSTGEWIVYKFLNTNLDEVEVTNLIYDPSNFELSMNFIGVVSGAKIKQGNIVLLSPRFSQGLVDITEPDKPAYFENAFEFESNISYRLGGSVRVIELPSGIDLNQEKLSYQYSCSDQGNTISEKRKITINTIYADSANLEEKTRFMEAVNQSYEQPIKLTN